MAVPTLDGAVSGLTAVVTSFTTAALTTTHPNDVIVLIVYNGTTAQRQVTSVTGGGLTWSKRGSYIGADPGYAGSYVELAVWWAPASAALSAQTFTVTLDGAAAVNYHLFGVSGANDYLAPWESTGPYTSGNGTVEYTTTGQDFIIATWGATSASSLGTRPSPGTWTTLGVIGNGNGTHLEYLNAWYQGRATSIANAVVSNTASPDYQVGLVDAIVGTGTATAAVTNARLTQGAVLVLAESTGANARLTQATVLALTENTGANARLTQAALLVLTDPPSPTVTRTVSVDAVLVFRRTKTVTVDAALVTARIRSYCFAQIVG